MGVLYCSNTLGAALGAALTGMVVLYYMGLAATVDLAAVLNITVAALALITLRRVCRFAWWLSFLLGFLSLSEEILWVRVIGFRHEGAPFAVRSP